MVFSVVDAGVRSRATSSARDRISGIELISGEVSAGARPCVQATMCLGKNEIKNIAAKMMIITPEQIAIQTEIASPVETCESGRAISAKRRDID